ncbi:MAG: hypothetical protein ACRDSL_20920 [Pseudonocardiaceae bacterium]
MTSWPSGGYLDTAGVTPGDLDRVAFFFDERYTDRELYQHYARHRRLPVRSSRELLVARFREQFGADLAPEAVESLYWRRPYCPHRVDSAMS